MTTVAVVVTTVAPSTTAAPIPDNAVQCGHNSVQARVISSGVAAGSLGYTIGLRNTGTTPCVLQGWPGVEMLDQHGRNVAISIPGLGAGDPGAVVVAPGGDANLDIMFSDGTGFASPYCLSLADLAITLPSGVGTIRMPFAATACSDSSSSPIRVTAWPVAPGSAR